MPKTRSPLGAARAFCLDCCGGSAKEVKECAGTHCPLHPFRFGRNPNFQLTDEQKAKRAANFKKALRETETAS